MFSALFSSHPIGGAWACILCWVGSLHCSLYFTESIHYTLYTHFIMIQREPNLIKYRPRPEGQRAEVDDRPLELDRKFRESGTSESQYLAKVQILVCRKK